MLSEAARMVNLFAKYWPSAEMKAESAALWAEKIQRYDPEDVMEAAILLGESRQWMPSLAEFVQGIKECRRDRLNRQQLLLPAPKDHMTLGEFLAQNPDWAERVKALDDKPWPLRDRDKKQPASTLALAKILKDGL